MPRGDRRGPDGMGPMTGRGLGYCHNYEHPGFVRGTPRGGAFYGRGFGRGFRSRGFSYFPQFQAPRYSQNDEEQYLSSEIETLKDELMALETRLSELKKDE